MNKILWLVFGLLSFLSFLPANEVYAVSAPDFATINLEDRFAKVGSSTNNPVRGSSANNYIDIVGSETYSSGGIWFDEMLNLNEDFHLEMYFAIGMPQPPIVAITPSEGWAFVMQSTGKGALAESGGQSIGVWANNSTTSLTAGAIPDGFAIEFDTFNNDDLGVPLFTQPATFDHDISLLLGGGSHIAWGYPARAETYRNYNFGGTLIPNYQKVMNHNDVSTYRDINLDLNNWRRFTVSYDASTNLLTYYSYWMREAVVIELDTSAFTHPENVYFGFTGSNSPYSQQRSVALRRLEIGDTVITPDGYESDSTVTLSGNMEVDDTEILDVNTGVTENVPVEELSFDEFMAETNEDKKTFTYNIVAEYENSASESLQKGAQITMRVPDILEPKDDPDGLITVNINGLEVDFEPVTSFSGDGREFMRVEGEDQYIFSLPELSDGDTVSISLTTVVKSDPDLIIDQKIELYEVFSASFEKENEIFVETGERDGTGAVFKRPHYILEAIYEPTLSGERLYESLAEAITKPGKYINLGAGFSTLLEAEDLNSTEATVYASNWGGEVDIANLPAFAMNDENYKDLLFFSRESIADTFDSEDLVVTANEFNTPGEYFRVFYLVDKEGNISSPKYIKITVLEKGVVELTAVPHLLFDSIDLSRINVLVDVDGFVNTQLVSGVVKPVTGLNAEAGNEVLELVVVNHYETPANWTLSAWLDDFVSVDLIADTIDTGNTIAASGIELHMFLDGIEAVVSDQSSLIHQVRDSTETFHPDPENIDATLRIHKNVLRTPGVYQGAINWEFTDSVQ